MKLSAFDHREVFALDDGVSCRMGIVSPDILWTEHGCSMKNDSKPKLPQCVRTESIERAS